MTDKDKKPSIKAEKPLTTRSSNTSKSLADTAAAASERIRKQLDDMLGPAEKLRRHMQELTAPSEQLRKQMEESLTPSDRLKEILGSDFDRTGPMQEILARSSRFSEQYAKQQSVFADSITSSFDRAFEGQKGFLEAAERIRAASVWYDKNVVGLHRSFEESAASQSDFTARIRESVSWTENFSAKHREAGERLTRLFESFPKEDAEEFRAAISASAEAALASVPETLGDTLESMSGPETRESAEAAEAAFAASPKPGEPHPFTVPAFWAGLPPPLRYFLMFMLFWVLLPAITEAMGDLLSQTVRQHFDAISDADREQVITNLKEAGGSAATVEFRTVAATSLNVRSDPDKSAATIASLPRGLLVRILRINGPWTFVEFPVSTSSALEQGWVASRYLRRLEAAK